ncbi:hypothetical protein CTAYLR_001634 [Chrysophaeum taylorii]|uniref:Uncharacterized protein n=1 Tax=Chrysophaeum taylorii TaxID=2483200 RepID=A0AAD7UC78_9STRA|nr:hypothetical protein CTAYLR_001634 [Chrysophaeum taylorii]
MESDGLVVSTEADEVGGVVTWRAIFGGVCVGALLCGSNMYFGLQTGWLTMGSLQSALVGYWLFRVKPLENVILQTTAVACATMPLAGGLVGVVPALKVLGHPLETWTEQLTWCCGLGFFGVFLAVPLRDRVLIRDKLEFPSGTATAKLIDVLNGTMDAEWRWLRRSLLCAVAYGAVTFLFPCASRVPIFGAPAARWQWTLCLSPAYLGQGAIMGYRSGLSMLVGAFVGLGLGVLAKRLEWAKGDIDDPKDGPAGFVLWLSIALMLGESLTNLARVALSSFSSPGRNENDDKEEVETRGVVPRAVWMGGLAFSSLACVVALREYASVFELVAAVACAALVSVLAVRALGETDLNPVSGVGKLSQLVFAVISPKMVLPNLVAGAVAEAGATQAGDMMQDLKTGLLLGVAPSAQFGVQILGSFCSILFSVALYRLYSSVYQIPGPDLPAPTALVWLDMAQLCARGGVLGTFSHLGPLGLAFFLAGALAPQNSPISPVATAIGMYLPARFSLPRVFGAFGARLWHHLHPDSHRRLLVVIASGFVLGEGLFAMLGASLRAFAAGGGGRVAPLDWCA